MKKYIVCLLLSVIFAICLCSCVDGGDKNNADKRQMEHTKIALAEAERQVGMPNIVNWQQRKLMKWIYELCDREELITYAYTKNEMTGKFVFLYKCLGYGIPFSAQFTNPEKLVEGDKYFGYNLAGYLNYLEHLPQADPNGLYMPTSSSATWLIPIKPGQNKPHVIYAEPEIVVSAFPFRESLVQNPEDYNIYAKKNAEGKVEGVIEGF